MKHCDREYHEIAEMSAHEAGRLTGRKRFVWESIQQRTDTPAVGGHAPDTHANEADTPPKGDAP